MTRPGPLNRTSAEDDRAVPEPQPSDRTTVEDPPAAPGPAAAPGPRQPPAPNPPLPMRQAIPYMLASVIIALSQGLSQGFLSVNLNQVAGDLGVTQTEASWLMAAYMIPRGAMPLALIKIRTQFGLRRFAEVGILAYVLVAFASIWVTDLRSAIVLQVLSGAASSSLTTLGFLYMLEPLAPQWKMRLGMPLVMVFVTVGPTLARIISPELIGDGGLMPIHLMTLGMALICLVLVYRLPLRPVPHMKVIERVDFLSFPLLAFGIAGMTISFVMGPIHYWDDAPWIGWLLAASAASIGLSIMIELNRAQPIIDVRWLLSPTMLHLSATLFLFRLLLSEQSTGAPRMFQVLGLGNEQMQGLFVIILLANVMGGLACIAWIKPERVPAFHLVALIMIAVGAFMDSHATVLTRPHEMFISQALIGFAALLFLPTAIMRGLMAALAKGPQYLLSFVIIFVATQSIGGIAGSGLFTTIINNRQAFHTRILSEGMAATDPLTTQAIAARMGTLAGQIGDQAALRGQAVSMIAQDISAQAFVMAYNDAYFLTALAAALAALALVLHLAGEALVRRLNPSVPAAPPGGGADAPARPAAPAAAAPATTHTGHAVTS